MHAGIDIRIRAYNNSGITRYLNGFVQHYCQHALLPGDRLTLLDSYRSSTSLHNNQNVTSKKLLTPPHFPLEKAALTIDMWRIGKLDLIHCVDFFAPFPKQYPVVCTALDVYFLLDPESHHPASYRHYAQFKDFVSKAAHVICISESTKSDLIAACSLSEVNVSVVYPGFVDLFTNSMHQHDAPSDVGRTNQDSSIVMVGTIEPRKNHLRALKAYEIVYSRLCHNTPKLIIIGKAGYRSAEFFSALSRSPARARIEYLSDVSDEALHNYYRQSTTLLYPSLYEGFGYPILEAFASHTVVVTSHLSSMKEIASGAAVLVDPLDSESIAEGIMQSLDEPLRSALIAAGKKKVSMYTWPKAVSAIDAIYRNIAT